MVGKFNRGNISMGIFRIAIMENNNNPVKSTNTVMGLFSAARTIVVIL